LNRIFLENETLSVKFLSRGSTWLDTGTMTRIVEVEEFVRMIEERQNIKIQTLKK
jgi:dTDP-glucose pyrophosphorylase